MSKIIGVTTTTPFAVDQDYSPKSQNAQSGKAVAQAIETACPKKVLITDGDTITLADNVTYYAEGEISTLTVIYPAGTFISSLEFKLASAGDITITLPQSKYIGGVPSFANGEEWEINIKNGVVVGGLVE